MNIIVNFLKKYKYVLYLINVVSAFIALSTVYAFFTVLSLDDLMDKDLRKINGDSVQIAIKVNEIKAFEEDERRGTRIICVNKSLSDKLPKEIIRTEDSQLLISAGKMLKGSMLVILDDIDSPVYKEVMKLAEKNKNDISKDSSTYMVISGQINTERTMHGCSFVGMEYPVVFTNVWFEYMLGIVIGLLCVLLNYAIRKSEDPKDFANNIIQDVKEKIGEENTKKLSMTTHMVVDKAEKFSKEAVQQAKSVVNEENLEKAKKIGQEGLSKAEDIGREGLAKVKSVINEDNIEKVKDIGIESVSKATDIAKEQATKAADVAKEQGNKATDIAKEHTAKAVQNISEGSKNLNMKVLGIGLAALVVIAGGALSFMGGHKDESVGKKIQSKSAVTQQAKTEKQKSVVAQPSIRYVYISGDDVVLREGPSANAKTIDSMNKNVRVQIMDTVKTGQEYPWFRVKLENGKTGYVFGKFISNTKVQQNVANNGIAIPKGYKLLRVNADYIEVTRSERNSMGGPKLCYDTRTLDFCVKTINDCRGKRTVVGGLDDEIITIYKSGKLKVVTFVGSTRIDRFYRTGNSSLVNPSGKNLVLFRLGNAPDGYRVIEKGSCNICEKTHILESNYYAFTTREGVRAALNDYWK